MIRMRTAAIILALLSPTLVRGAQEVAPAAALREFQAARVAKGPVIDGVLDDEAWAGAAELTGFTQRDPDEGKPATENTVVKVVYDEDAIYFGARLEDSQKVTTLLGRRDSQLESDWFRIYLDPHLDRRSGASFWVNPSNVQFDMVLYNDNWDAPDWDAVWESATSITPAGWIAEVRIPYSQLRFPDREKHRWGINLIRRIVRTNEYAYLVFTPKKESGFVSRFGFLDGIEGIKPRRAFEVAPYGVTRSDLRGTVAIGDPLNDPSEFRADAGVDLKYGLTSNLTLTGTINPDFGQVEVDPAQVNLSAFELFFPEKRPFFIEGSSLFEFGQGGSNNNFNINFFPPILFYSRRIGRAPQGTGNLAFDYINAPNETTILGAGKISGKTGNGWTIAALDALTEEERASFTLGPDRHDAVVEPMTNYLVTRIAKDIGSKSQGRVGALVTSTNRDLPGEMSFLREEAYLAGIDGHWFFGDRAWLLEWFVAGSEVGGSTRALSDTQTASSHYYQRPDADHIDFDPSRTSLSGLGGRVSMMKQTGNWRFNIQAQSYSPGFEVNDVGFMQRADVTSTHFAVLYNHKKKTDRLQDFGGWAAKWQNWNWDGDMLENGLGAVGWALFKNYYEHWGEVFSSAERYDDRGTRGGPLMKRPASFWIGTGGITDTRKKFAVDYRTGHGNNEAGGWDHDYGLTLTYRPASNVSLKFQPRYNEFLNVAQYVSTIPDPDNTTTYGKRYVFAEIEQTTLELGTRVDWTYSARLTFQLYLQPFVASGDYGNFKELAAPGTFEFNEYQGLMTFDPEANRIVVAPPPAEGKSTAEPFSFANPDFNFRSVRGSAVMRWEFRPGSALYLVWNENRAEALPFGDFSFRRDLSAIPQIESDDVFLIKLSYWLPL